ncbi:Uncharacterized protein NEOC65_001219 [Neochlamydia sp. AcF65]|uniref:hypothetical protein n=1 Tax=unclassified Neochlamydia TaxID=2643326 RepID=UPI00140A6ACD|nr:MULTISPECIES: hypothetical protein [unclassified Neochlamydia]MBS4166139.1 Uncharacterized protein [Neochlamydia sp. AcF65]NGY95484.1 hypothetical protein [Neochlamydia sp. AcF84]
MQFDPYSDSQGFTDSLLRHFSEVGSNMGKGNLAQKVNQAQVILIGETHNQATEKIHQLVTTLLVTHITDKATILVEGQAFNRSAKVLSSHLEEHVDKVDFSSWDSPETWKFLDIFLGEVTDHGNKEIAKAIKIYLDNPDNVGAMCERMHTTMQDLTQVTDKLANYIEEWPSTRLDKEDFKTILKESASNLKTILQPLEVLQEKDEQATITASEIAILPLKLLSQTLIFMQALGQTANDLIAMSHPSRNQAMVENISIALKSYEKVIVIAGRAHLSSSSSPGSLGENIHIAQGIQILGNKLLSEASKNRDFNYLILETREAADDLPEIQALPEEMKEPLGSIIKGKEKKTERARTALDAQQKNQERSGKQIRRGVKNELGFQAIESNIYQIGKITDLSELREKFNDIYALILENASTNSQQATTQLNNLIIEILNALIGLNYKELQASQQHPLQRIAKSFKNIFN